jgi:hypothetical protein
MFGRNGVVKAAWIGKTQQKRRIFPKTSATHHNPGEM